MKWAQCLRFQNEQMSRFSDPWEVARYYMFPTNLMLANHSGEFLPVKPPKRATSCSKSSKMMCGNPCFRFHVKFWGCDSHGSHHHLRCPDQHLRFLTGIFHINQDLETMVKLTGKNMKNVRKIKQQTQTKCLSDKKKVHNHHSQQIHEKDETRQKLCCSLRFPGCSFYTVVDQP